MANAFGGRAPPGPIWGSFNAPPDPLAAIGGGVLLLRGRREGGEEKEAKEERGGKG